MNKYIKFNKKVIKPTVKEIKRHKKKYDSTPNESDLGKLKIQTANPLIRILSILLALFLIGWGSSLLLSQDFVFSGILLVIGIILVILGVRGRKRELHYVLEAIDFEDGIKLVIEAISSIDL